MDALAVHKKVGGDIEVAHLSNLSDEEAVEFGTAVGALIGLGIEGEEGLEAGAEGGGRAAADGIHVFSDEDAWDVLEDIPEDRPRDRHARAPLGGPAAQRGRARPAGSGQRRLHQSA